MLKVVRAFLLVGAAAIIAGCVDNPPNFYSTGSYAPGYTTAPTLAVNYEPYLWGYPNNYYPSYAYYHGGAGYYGAWGGHGGGWGAGLGGRR